jgi:chromosome segregation ATPase
MDPYKTKHSLKTTKEAPLTYSKANFQVVEQERNLLKITLDYVAKENDMLKQQLEDMKMTVKHNKELLKEYIEKITSKDKVVEKMNSTIEQLQTRLHSLEEYIKNKYF